MKRMIRQIGGWPGIAKLVRRRKRGPVILFYHGVEDGTVDPRVQSIHLNLSDFEKQIAYLRKHYQIISMDDLYDCIARDEELDPSYVVLTFDDGYRNNRTVVGPYLSTIGVPFAVFVSTRHIDEKLRFPTYYLRAAIQHSTLPEVEMLGSVLDISSDRAKRASFQKISKALKTAPLSAVEEIVESLIGIVSSEQWSQLDARYSSDAPMSWKELKELKALGATIGSHCHDHCILHQNQDTEEIERQLRLSKEQIEFNIGECNYIAYPNGGKDDMCVSALREAQQQNYRLGLTTVEGEVESRETPYLLPRIAADTNDFERFKFNLNLAFRHNDSYRKWAGD